MGDESPLRQARRGVPLAVRIAAAVLFAFVAAATAAGVYLGVRVRDLAQRDLEGGLETDHALLAEPVRVALASGDHATLGAIAARAATTPGTRVTIILPDGTVIAESEQRLPLPSHADRPEIVAALRDGAGRVDRTSTTTGVAYAYSAWRIDGADGRPAGVLRLGRPRSAIEAVDRQVAGIVLISLLLGLPVAAAVGWLAARRIARPLEEMTAAAARMASGDFAHLPRARGRDEAGRLAAALERMGLELSEMLRVRDAQRAETEAILAAMAEGVLAVDRDSRIVLANRAVAECLGLADTPKPGTPLQEVVRLPEITAQLRTALAGRRAGECDVTLPGAAGRVLGVGAAPVGPPAADGAAGPPGAVLVLRDVTVIRRLERTRLDFVANVSHELRTPLAAVLGAIETAQDLGDDEPEGRGRMLETATRHGRRLSAIVDDLLALSQIESEGDRLERVPVPLLRTLRSAASAVAVDAAARGVTLALPPADAPEIHVLGHEGRLEQVWTNLLSNAVKYNRPQGSVTVTVGAEPAARIAHVAVRDSGPGIASEHLPRIFERFYRVDRGRSRDQGGTGLGLAIVKHIVRAHRGAIRVESVPGEGSVFRVTLPVAGGPPGGRLA